MQCRNVKTVHLQLQKQQTHSKHKIKTLLFPLIVLTYDGVALRTNTTGAGGGHFPAVLLSGSISSKKEILQHKTSAPSLIGFPVNGGQGILVDYGV